MAPEDLYREHRPLMFSIAYRMLGSVSEAEDIVQDAFVRLHRASGEATVITSPKAYLAAITTRLAIDHLRSARVRRESYVGTWLPEPLVGDAGPDAATHAEMAESLSMAFLVVLESLSPVERAVFLLREVFQYAYPEIARIVGKTEANCRQIFSRAQRHVNAGRPRFTVPSGESEAVAREFFSSAARGDVEGLLRLLAPDIAFHGDGGGKAPSVREPVRGPQAVGRVLRGLMTRMTQLGLLLRPVSVNGQPGAMVLDGHDRLVSVVCVDVAGGRISAIRSVANPDKLHHLEDLRGA